MLMFCLSSPPSSSSAAPRAPFAPRSPRPSREHWLMRVDWRDRATSGRKAVDPVS